MKRRGSLRFGGKDLHFRLKGGRGRCDAATEAASAEAGDDRGYVGQVFENLQTGGGVAGDEIVVVEGMNEDAVKGGMLAFGHGGPALIHGRLSDSCAEPLDCVELGDRGGIHD